MGTKHSTAGALSQRSDRGSPMATSSNAPVTYALTAPPSSFGKLSTATIRPHDMLSVHTGDAPNSTLTPLDVKITNALKELKRNRVAEDGDSTCQDQFTRTILKFPVAARAFNSVRSTFQALDKGSKGYIVYSDMEDAFERLGVKMCKDEMREIFQESDMVEDGRLSFKEFLVCLAICFVLHVRNCERGKTRWSLKIPSLENERLSIFYAPMNPKDSSKGATKDKNTQGGSILFGEGNKLRVAFQMAVDSFLWFDVDGSGQINRNEMATRLSLTSHLHSPTKRTSSNCHRDACLRSDAPENSIWERRFNEMDWNHDGSIHFKEFLMAFESWVGLDDDEGADDDE